MATNYANGSVAVWLSYREWREAIDMPRAQTIAGIKQAGAQSHCLHTCCKPTGKIFWGNATGCNTKGQRSKGTLQLPPIGGA
jgi:hypothetical protein